MKMKKVIASVIAGIVAVSAMATSAFAATTENGTWVYETKTTSTLSATVVLTADNTDVTVDLPTDFDAATKVASLTRGGTTYTGDTAAMYAPIASKVVTVKGAGLKIGDAVTFTVTANVDTTYTAKSSITLTTSATTYLASSTKAVTTKTAKYAAVPSTATELNQLINTGVLATSPVYPLNGLTQKVAADIGANKGAKLVFTFKDLGTDAATDPSAPSYTQSVSFAGSVSADDFAIMINGSNALKASAKLDGMTISYDIDTLLAAAKLDSATAVVNSIMVKAQGDLVTATLDDGSARYVLASISIVTADADVPADTTTPADTTDTDNAKTGVAPVALALIPVALAAAVVVAKRK